MKKAQLLENNKRQQKRQKPWHGKWDPSSAQSVSRENFSADSPGTVPDCLAASLSVQVLSLCSKTRTAPIQPVLSGQSLKTQTVVTVLKQDFIMYGWSGTQYIDLAG